MSDPQTTAYRCPQEIEDIFKTAPERGRELAVNWAMGLALKPGDRVWMPELGWQQYDGGESGNA